MTIHYKIRFIAGTLVLASLALGWWVSPWWLLFTAFVGANLVQSAFTRWCLMEDILRWTGLENSPREGGPSDVSARPARRRPVDAGTLR